jgi:tripartite-type tricarboxylate transporter receptor subunit TctC
LVGTVGTVGIIASQNTDRTRIFHFHSFGTAAFVFRRPLRRGRNLTAGAAIAAEWPLHSAYSRRTDLATYVSTTYGIRPRFAVPLFALVALAGVSAASAWAQSDFPARPIKLYVPVPPGGGADFIARIVAEKMGADLGRPIVVENKGGASGSIASQEVARAPADGYAILECYVATHGTSPAVSKLPYDPLKDFTAIGMMAATSNVLVVGDQVKAGTLKEFIALARARPNGTSYGTTGIGSATHLTMAYLEQQAGISLVHVPYKGAGPALADLVGGQVEAMFPGLTAAIPHIRSGRLRALAISASSRTPLLPEVPTVAESGYPAFNALQWYGLCAPAHTPRTVVERLNAALNNALANPDVRRRLAEQGADAMPMSPETFTEFLRNDLAKWVRLVKDANLRIEQ